MSLISSSPQFKDPDYCVDNSGVCIGVPVAAIIILILLVFVVILFAYPTTRNMICELQILLVMLLCLIFYFYP